MISNLVCSSPDQPTQPSINESEIGTIKIYVDYWETEMRQGPAVRKESKVVGLDDTPVDEKAKKLATHRITLGTPGNTNKTPETGLNKKL